MKHITYPKISQFRQVVSNIKRQASFVGLDDNGDPIYNELAEQPKLTFHGSIKLHGTNSSVCLNENGMWIQSRSRIISVESDNNGFAFFVSCNQDVFLDLISQVQTRHEIDTSTHTISLYGEWAGEGIQKGVAISKLPKAFYIFGVKITNENDGVPAYWANSSELRSPGNRIYNILDFSTYQVEIDFNNPEFARNKIVELTEQVENECPVSKQLGVNGIGEGIVWHAEYNGTNHRFKTKGEKHSVSKVKTLAPVDTEKVANVNEFVEYAVTQNRFDQAIQEVFGKHPPQIEKTGDLIRWMINDVISEEIDTLKDNGLTPKDVNSKVATKTRQMLSELL